MNGANFLPGEMSGNTGLYVLLFSVMFVFLSGGTLRKLGDAARGHPRHADVRPLFDRRSGHCQTRHQYLHANCFVVLIGLASKNAI